MTFTHSHTDRPVISDGMPSQLPDADPDETAERHAVVQIHQDGSP